MLTIPRTQLSLCATFRSHSGCALKGVLSLLMSTPNVELLSSTKKLYQKMRQPKRLELERRGLIRANSCCPVKLGMVESQLQFVPLCLIRLQVWSWPGLIPELLFAKIHECLLYASVQWHKSFEKLQSRATLNEIPM